MEFCLHVTKESISVVLVYYTKIPFSKVLWLLGLYYTHLHREVIKVSFMECYEYYITTAQDNSTKLDKQAMMVS